MLSPTAEGHARKNPMPKMSSQESLPHSCLELAAEITAAYVTNNHIAATDLPGLFESIHWALCNLEQPSDELRSAIATTEVPSPAQIRRSVQHDHIMSFIDGRLYRTLKRHLTAHGLTPETYRARYRLPNDYPTVAPSYAEQRSAIAKAIGLGVPGAQSVRRPQQAAE
ncbi:MULTISPECIES: MucR family transcriptional regulator [unclassified Methylobacterium]|uniref:MucR family transcriptional regulator n=1 Tax=unclassified Methylobacterium TaxID=2615210 RepID=UPI001FEEBCC3|nr:MULTISPECIES: MucR family transcriptional regulator [unclassified Methylobacterium]